MSAQGVSSPMNKNELIEAVAASSGLSKADAGRAVDGVVGSITGALKAGESVNLIGFGTFDVRARRADRPHPAHQRGDPHRRREKYCLLGWEGAEERKSTRLDSRHS